MAHAGRIARVGAVLICLSGLVLAGASTARSQEEQPVVCNAAGVVSQTETAPGSGTYQWSLTFSGNCNGDRRGPYLVNASGAGTSTGLGVCDGSGLVQDLDLLVDISFVSQRSPAFNVSRQERWFAPATTYPFATPYLIEHVGEEGPNTDGAGILFNHIFFNCSGSPSAVTLGFRFV